MPRLTLPRVLLIIASLGTAVVLQSSILARLGLPGATPDLLLVVVLVIALVSGPLVGAVTGFAAGVLVDLAPPAAGSLGQTAAIWRGCSLLDRPCAVRTRSPGPAVRVVCQRNRGCCRVGAGDRGEHSSGNRR